MNKIWIHEELLYIIKDIFTKKMYCTVYARVVNNFVKPIFYLKRRGRSLHAMLELTLFLSMILLQLLSQVSSNNPYRNKVYK